MKSLLPRTLAFLLLVSFAAAQSDTLTNVTIIEMAKAGLGDEIILAALRRSEAKFDVTPKALLELKNGGVSDAVILVMIQKHDSSNVSRANDQQVVGYSDSDAQPEVSPSEKTPRTLLKEARTIALVKSSAQPSRQALEKELLKRPEWKGLNLVLHRYKDDADLYVEIGYVSMSWITHRYVYRIYDRRSGTVIAAGETTSWGSLAENLARHIAKSLANVSRS